MAISSQNKPTNLGHDSTCIGCYQQCVDGCECTSSRLWLSLASVRTVHSSWAHNSLGIHYRDFCIKIRNKHWSLMYDTLSLANCLFFQHHDVMRDGRSSTWIRSWKHWCPLWWQRSAPSPMNQYTTTAGVDHNPSTTLLLIFSVWGWRAADHSLSRSTAI